MVYLSINIVILDGKEPESPIRPLLGWKELHTTRTARGPFSLCVVPLEGKPVVLLRESSDLPLFCKMRRVGHVTVQHPHFLDSLSD